MDTLPPFPPARNGINRNTIAVPAFAAQQPGLETRVMSDAFVLAQSALQARNATAGEGGYRLFWVRGGNVGWCELPARGDAYAVIGRHTQCDLVLPDDSMLSLRHLLARTIELDDGPSLRVMDLHTSVPFVLEDGVARRSILISGTVLFRLGSYVLGAMAFEKPQPRSALELPAGARELPAGVPGYTVSESGELPRVGRRGLHQSHITVMPPPAQIGERAMSSHHPAAAPFGASSAARVTLERDGHVASAELSDADLDRGVLIGRSEKCLDGGLRGILTEQISRAHVLLVRERDGVYAYDLCSSNGTYVQGAATRRTRMAESGTVLTLSAAKGVTLVWHARRG